MSDPFSVALDALFASTMAVDAFYVPAVGAAIALRVVKSGPDRTARFGQMQVDLGTLALDVRMSELARPFPGDRFIIGGETFQIPSNVKPISDVEGLTWTCWTEPVA